MTDFASMTKEELVRKLFVLEEVITHAAQDASEFVKESEELGHEGLPIVAQYRGRGLALCLALDLAQGKEIGTNRKEFFCEARKISVAPILH